MLQRGGVIPARPATTVFASPSYVTVNSLYTEGPISIDNRTFINQENMLIKTGFQSLPAYTSKEQIIRRADLKSAQCRFESDRGHPESAGRGDFDGPHHGSEAASVSPNVITTRLKLVAAALRASSWLWAYTAIVNAALACPSEGAIVAIGTLRACIDDAQLCRAS